MKKESKDYTVKINEGDLELRATIVYNQSSICGNPCQYLNYLIFKGSDIIASGNDRLMFANKKHIKVYLMKIFNSEKERVNSGT